VRYLSPGQSFTAILINAPTGIAAQLAVRGVAVETDGDPAAGAVVVGPIDAGAGSGVVEESPGNYWRADLVAPSEAMTFEVIWDHNGVEIPDPELIEVTYTPPVAPGDSLYVSPPQVRAVLAPEGENDQSTAAQLSDAALVEQIVAAQREIDARLRDRYSVPFGAGAVPGLVVELARDIAAYLATLTHRRAGEVSDSEVIRLRYTRAKEILTQLGSGEVDLDTPPAEATAESAEPTVINPYDGDLFAKEQLGVHPWPV
jgi:phage gp36-like protein